MTDQLQEEKLDEVIKEVKTTSFEEKRKSISAEEMMNKFLDGISLIKNAFNETNNKLEHILPNLQELTWFINVTEGDLIKINEIIALGKDLHTTLNRNILFFKSYKTNGILALDIDRYEDNVSSLLESIQTLEDVFFYFPNDSNFQENTKFLESL